MRIRQVQTVLLLLLALTLIVLIAGSSAEQLDGADAAKLRFGAIEAPESSFPRLVAPISLTLVSLFVLLGLASSVHANGTRAPRELFLSVDIGDRRSQASLPAKAYLTSLSSRRATMICRAPLPIGTDLQVEAPLPRSGKQKFGARVLRCRAAPDKQWFVVRLGINPTPRDVAAVRAELLGLTRPLAPTC